MGQPPQPAIFLALPLIAQCRADIAAAWEHVEAGRRILANSAWLLQRWAEQARAPDHALGDASSRPMGGEFVTVEETPRQKLRRRRRAHPRNMTPARFMAAGRKVQSPAASP